MAGSTAARTTTPLDGPKLADNPFVLGVASGDPTSESIILWTRLVGDFGAQTIPVVWEIADDERFVKVRSSGTMLATDDLGHSLHVDVAGLDPGRDYFFRFRVRDYESTVGRTATAPSPRSTSPCSFAFASCQEYQEGHYAAWRDIAESGLDLVVFLGDYIYEHGVSDSGVRTHEAGVVVSLDEYRARYATYRADEYLQAAHAACPWLVVWDDHEVSDNYANLVPGFTLDGPQLDTEAFRRRRAAGYRAWYEHMPVRVAPPNDEHLRIHRTVPWGSLANFVLLDSRQYRSDQTCNAVDIGPMCDEMVSADVTLLGREQHAWLEAELDRSAATWNLIGNQVVFAPMPFSDDDTLQLDTWDGYPLVRRRVTQFLDDHGVRNPVILTGDVHLGAVFDVHAVPDDPSSSRVATELVGTSITSTSDSILMANADTIRRRNEHLRWIDFEHRGYTRVDCDDAELRAEYRVVTDPLRADSPVRVASAWVIPDGEGVTEA